MLKMGTGLPWSAVLPLAIESTAGMLRPLFEKVDVAQYMRMSRSLKVGEDYATLLMEPLYGKKAQTIAREFVRGYPDHGFIITPEKAKSNGLNIVEPDEALCSLLERTAQELGS